MSRVVSHRGLRGCPSTESKAGAIVKAAKCLITGDPHSTTGECLVIQAKIEGDCLHFFLIKTLLRQKPVGVRAWSRAACHMLSVD